MAQPLLNLDLNQREILFSRIVEILDEMPESLRDVFVLTHYEGKSPSEVASILGIPESDFGSLLIQANQYFYRTLRRLR